MRTIYIADDNKEFDDEFECERYEWLLKHPHLKDIKCYDKDGNLFADIMDDDTYNYSVKIVVPSVLAFSSLLPASSPAST